MSFHRYNSGYDAAVTQAQETGDWSLIAARRGDKWTIAKGVYKGREITVDSVTASGTIIGSLVPKPGEYWKDIRVNITSLGARTVDGWQVEQDTRAALQERHRQENLRATSQRTQERRAALTHLRGKVGALIDADPVASARRLRAVGDLICTYPEPPRRGYTSPTWRNRATLYRWAYQLDGDGSRMFNAHGGGHTRPSRVPKQGA